MLGKRLARVKHFALALFAAAFLLGAVEIGLRVNHSFRLQSAADSFDRTSLLSPSWTSHHTLKPLKSTSRRNPDTKLSATMRTNSLGLRGETILVPKPSDTYRILYLGDDTVLALEFAEADTFCQLIKKDLFARTGLRVEVINAGQPNYCPLLSYLHFKHNLAVLQPDLILLNFDMSDVADDHFYRRHTQIGPEGIPLICTNPALRPPAQASSNSLGGKLLLVQSLKRRLGSLPADKDRESDTGDFETPAGRYAWTREERAEWRIPIAQALSPIAHLKQLANQLSCPLVVTISPVPWQISARAMPDPTSREAWGIPLGQVYDPKIPIRPVIEFLNAQAIPYCDATPRFQADPKPESLFLDSSPRFSQSGHRLFAKVVVDYLARTTISPTSRSRAPYAAR